MSLSLVVLLAAGSPLAAFLPDGVAEPERLSGERVIVRVLDTPDRSEVMLLAGVRVRATPEAFRACVRDPACLRAGEDLLGAGRLSMAPDAEELDAISLEAPELAPLRRCRVGACSFRLSASGIEELRREVDWTLPHPEETAARVLRGVLAGYARAYAAEGNRALPPYDNNEHPVKSGESLGLLLTRPLYLLEDMPELARYLAAFPRGRPAATEEYLCWSKEKVWKKRVLALDHVVVHERHEDGAFRIVAAAKRIYASHCFESSLQLLALEGSPGADENTLVHLSRTRADIRPSGFNWLERLLIRKFGRGRLEGHLRALKERLESPPSP